MRGNVQAISERNGIYLNSEGGNPQGFAELSMITANIEAAIKASRLIMIVVPAFAHADIARKISLYLSDGQIIVLHPGRTFGAIEFRKVLNRHGCTANVIVRRNPNLYLCLTLCMDLHRLTFIASTSKGTTFSSFPGCGEAEVVLEATKPYYPQFFNGKTVFHTGMNNIGAVFHPAILLLNTGWIEATGGDFQFYVDGVTPKVARIMEAIDRERVRVAAALGIQAITACRVAQDGLPVWMVVIYTKQYTIKKVIVAL